MRQYSSMVGEEFCMMDSCLCTIYFYFHCKTWVDILVSNYLFLSQVGSSAIFLRGIGEQGLWPCSLI